MITYCVLSSLQKILRASCLSIFRGHIWLVLFSYFTEPNLQSHAEVSCVTPPTETPLKNFSDNECSMKRFSRKQSLMD